MITHRSKNANEPDKWFDYLIMIQETINKKEAELRVRHIGIIMDGNRRWSHKNFVPISNGYQKGADTLKKLILF